MNHKIATLRPFIVAVVAALVTTVGAMAPEQKPVGNWQSAFKKIIPSMNCVLGRKSCSPHEIQVARKKVRAYIAVFGTAAVALGIRSYMKPEKKRQGSVFEKIEINEEHRPAGGTQRYVEPKEALYEPGEVFGATPYTETASHNVGD